LKPGRLHADNFEGEEIRSCFLAGILLLQELGQVKNPTISSSFLRFGSSVKDDVASGTKTGAAED
jgi:hypothetical protein